MLMHRGFFNSQQLLDNPRFLNFQVPIGIAFPILRQGEILWLIKSLEMVVFSRWTMSMLVVPNYTNC
jgi:hypothetical protein